MGPRVVVAAVKRDDEMMNPKQGPHTEVSAHAGGAKHGDGTLVICRFKSMSGTLSSCHVVFCYFCRLLYVSIREESAEKGLRETFTLITIISTVLMINVFLDT